MGVYRAALLLFVYTQRNRTHCGAKAQVCRPLLLYWTVSTTLSALGSSNEHRHGLNGRLQEIRTRHTFPLCITSVVVVWFTLIVGIYFRFCFFFRENKNKYKFVAGKESFLTVPPSFFLSSCSSRFQDVSESTHCAPSTIFSPALRDVRPDV